LKITFNSKVEYYSTKETKSEWLLGATNVAEQTFTLYHLKSNAEYTFFIRSVSPEGAVSGPSPLSDPVRTLHVGSKSTELELVLEQARRKLCDTIVVILKNVYATSSTSLRIEWQVKKKKILYYFSKLFIIVRPFRSFQHLNLWKDFTSTTEE
jgi:hypothetical protein